MAGHSPPEAGVQGRPMPWQSAVGRAVCNWRPCYLPWGLAPCCATCCSLTPTPTGLGSEDREEGEQGNCQAQSAAG